MEEQPRVWRNVSNDLIPHHVLAVTGGVHGRDASLLIRKMETESGHGVVARELWPAGEEAPRTFYSDKELADAMAELGLPVIKNLETVRRHVAAMRLPK